MGRKGELTRFSWGVETISRPETCSTDGSYPATGPLTVAPPRRKRKPQLCLDPSDVEGLEVEMIWVGGREPSAPSATHCFPT